jgi:SAM-dependent methyltransferase
MLIGLCATCRHAEVVVSSRGSTFQLCRLSTADPRFARYPTLPVLACDGYAVSAAGAHDPTTRFASRVENYVKYRPRYPQAIASRLAEVCGLTVSSRVADVGSGTGLLSEVFLDHGNRVVAIEPNREMRDAGSRLLRHRRGFFTVGGRAEALPLVDGCLDFVVAGQAFHWFDRVLARREFARGLRSDGWVVLVWNERETESTPFLMAYEDLLKRYAVDYDRVDHRLIDDGVLADFFGRPPQYEALDNGQVFDFDGLKGRLLSSSYTPEPDHPNHQPMLDALARIFDEHADHGHVVFKYVTKMYYGHLS